MTIHSPILAARILALALITIESAGCGGAPIGVKRKGIEKVFAETTAYALSAGVPSQFSILTLARADLLTRYEDSPEEAIAELRKMAVANKDRDQVFAMAELSYLLGEQLAAKKHYLASAAYAYLFLFHPLSKGAREPFDPRFRIASNIYNCALSQFLRSKDGDAVLESGIHELPSGKMTIHASRPGFPWGPEEFSRFVPALDFSVRGLRSRNRNPGLGAPLIAIRTPPTKEKKKNPGERADPLDYLAPRLKTGATAFLRITGTENRGDIINLAAELELYTPFTTQEIDVEGQKIPLEADLTAPLAYALQEPKIWKFEISGLLSGESADFKNGIYFQEPYVPGKIPVVFVHGTASSPARWAEMFNELYSYRDLREKFQFWFFLYNTGWPILVSGQKLHDAIEEAVSRIDPEGKDPALRQMVVLGHSQGGLLVKMQVSDSQETFLDEEVRKLIEDLRLTKEQEDDLRKIMIFKPLPYIRRVVFVATPHHGSYQLGGWISSILRSLVGAPKKMAQFAKDLTTDQKTGLPKGVDFHIPTSIENMEPGNRFVLKLAALPVVPGVKAHSIIAVDAEGPLEDGRDGVVAWKSAHMEPVESEFIVRSGHSCQSNPLTILEVRRILFEHLKSLAPPATGN
jgi:PGAP1-like protein